MSLLDAYEDDIIESGRVSATLRAPEIPQQDQKATSWLPYKSVSDYIKSQTTLPRAVAAGASEVVGNVIDMASAAGQVAAAAGGITPGFDPSQRPQESAEAMANLKAEGINWRPEFSRPAYQFAQDLRPDPATASTAENIVFGLTKGLSKAIGMAATVGPVAGAVGFGASEGMTMAEDLAAQGVDEATRTKAGLVTAGATALGMGIPLSGRTLGQTAGLVLVGGPGTFIAQQSATQDILRNADYGAIAEQYDPLDLVGLSLATLVPAGFAAFAMRGALRARPTQGQQGEIAPQAQEMALPVNQEAVDAAMVQNLTAAHDLHISVKPEGEEVLTNIEPPPRAVREPEPIDGVKARDTTPEAYRARIEEMLTENPDMVYRVDENGNQVSLADEIQSIRKQIEEGTDAEFGTLDAPLLQVAAECALSIGTMDK